MAYWLYAMLPSNHKWDDNVVLLPKQLGNNQLLYLVACHHDILITSLWNQYDVTAAMVTSLEQKRARPCMPCPINFSLTLQTEIFSTVTSDFLKQMIVLKLFSSVSTEVIDMKLSSWYLHYHYMKEGPVTL